jgi:DNA-directed RNA polymerase specialized sigma24 family protein
VSDRDLSSVDAADTRALVERELGRLPTDQREVLVLRLLNEKSYREIAAITGKKVGTDGWLVSVGLKTLSRELAPLLSPDGSPGSVHGTPGLGLAQGEA